MVWVNMIKRCHDTSDVGFHQYGARGIYVCERWRFGEGNRDGFERFVDDMGEKPDKGMSIDRINNAGPYEPDNCRWATKAQQMANRGGKPKGPGEMACFYANSLMPGTDGHSEEYKALLWKVDAALTKEALETARSISMWPEDEDVPPQE